MEREFAPAFDFGFQPLQRIRFRSFRNRSLEFALEFAVEFALPAARCCTGRDSNLTTPNSHNAAQLQPALFYIVPFLLYASTFFHLEKEAASACPSRRLVEFLFSEFLVESSSKSHPALPKFKRIFTNNFKFLPALPARQFLLQIGRQVGIPTWNLADPLESGYLMNIFPDLLCSNSIALFKFKFQ